MDESMDFLDDQGVDVGDMVGDMDLDSWWP